MYYMSNRLQNSTASVYFAADFFKNVIVNTVITNKHYNQLILINETLTNTTFGGTVC